jgi:hypothetical protein
MLTAARAAVGAAILARTAMTAFAWQQGRDAITLRAYGRHQVEAGVNVNVTPVSLPLRVRL